MGLSWILICLWFFGQTRLQGAFLGWNGYGTQGEPGVCLYGGGGGGQGGTRTIHDGGGGGSDVYFWVENLHAQYFFVSSHDLSHIFLGLYSERTFHFGFPLRSADQKNIHSNFFSATCVPKKLLILRRQYNVHL